MSAVSLAQPPKPADPVVKEDSQVTTLKQQIQNDQQQISSLRNQGIMVMMELNREKINNLNEKLKPLEDERAQMIQSINQNSPGAHWDDSKNMLVANPTVKAPVSDKKK
jgi:peptidoglycan hydrolase CwlO-like protein